MHNEACLHVCLLDLSALNQRAHAGLMPATPVPQYQVERRDEGAEIVALAFHPLLNLDLLEVLGRAGVCLLLVAHHFFERSRLLLLRRLEVVRPEEIAEIGAKPRSTRTSPNTRTRGAGNIRRLGAILASLRLLLRLLRLSRRRRVHIVIGSRNVLLLRHLHLGLRTHSRPRVALSSRLPRLRCTRRGIDARRRPGGRGSTGGLGTATAAPKAREVCKGVERSGWRGLLLLLLLRTLRLHRRLLPGPSHPCPHGSSGRECPHASHAHTRRNAHTRAVLLRQALLRSHAGESRGAHAHTGCHAAGHAHTGCLRILRKHTLRTHGSGSGRLCSAHRSSRVERKEVPKLRVAAGGRSRLWARYGGA
eukprot:Opistho-2@62034